MKTINPTEFKVAELIYKFVSKTISTQEQQVLDKWLQNPENLQLFNKITNTQNLKEKYAIYKQIETESIYKNIEQKALAEAKKVKTIKLYNTLKYAAVVVVLLSVGFIFKDNIFNSKPSIQFPEEQITLELDNGAIKVINEDGTSDILDSNGDVIGAQKGGQLVYTDDSEHEKLIYNTLKVPYGKRFKLQLSDGTTVHLNAGTSLKYPVKFLKNATRQVYLKGEAFFDVAKDKVSGQKFMVNTSALNVEVLGTQFNFSNYPEDNETAVVLVEGSVNLSDAKNSANNLMLSPGFMGTFDKSGEAKISKKPVITSVYTAWVDGELVFRNMTFGNILKKMERHYDVSIVNQNKHLTNEKFNASFRQEPIEKILEYFEITYNIHFEIEDNKIYVK